VAGHSRKDGVALAGPCPAIDVFQMSSKST
jgi:hypothetical protein